MGKIKGRKRRLQGDKRLLFLYLKPSQSLENIQKSNFPHFAAEFLQNNLNELEATCSLQAIHPLRRNALSPASFQVQQELYYKQDGNYSGNLTEYIINSTSPREFLTCIS